MKEGNKNILIAGGRGFLGTALKSFFEKKGHTVWVLTRNPKLSNEIFWDGETEGEWCSKVGQTDVVINLCGKSVDCRYTTKNKKEILESRIIPTSLLNNVISKSISKPKLFINASSSTIYIHSEDQPMDEVNGVIGDDFSMNIVKQWEKAFFKKEISGVRKIALRISFVLGKDGGALPKLSVLSKLGLGGKQGNGRQMVSWIHIEDFCRAVDRIIERDNLKGVINITSPKPITNSSFMAAIRSLVRSPFHINQPAWLLEIATFFMRTETELILKSRFVIPSILLNDGFKFKYTMIEQIK